MAYWFAAILGALSLALLVRLVLEWRHYARGGRIITREHLALRIASAIVLVLLLAMVVVGTTVEFRSPEMAFAYWGGSLGLALTAVITAIVDLALLRRRFGRRRAERYLRLSKYLRALDRQRTDRVRSG